MRTTELSVVLIYFLTSRGCRLEWSSPGFEQRAAGGEPADKADQAV